MNREMVDLVVVGAGMAGVCAAIEAAERGLQVLLLDATYGGGASGISGGVIYAGGGTVVQKEAGVSDSADNMYNYLKCEVGQLVSDDMIHQFCNESASTINWLIAKGVKFESTICPYKTSYPSDQFYLYYSGNEKCYPYNQAARPVPRGHRVYAKGLDSGKVLMQTLLDYAKKMPHLDFRPLCKVTELLIENGEVKGLRYTGVQNFDNSKHRRYANLSNNYGKYIKTIGVYAGKKADRILRSAAAQYEVRAHGVVLSAGGFIFNKEMLAEYDVKDAADLMPLGTIYDNGNGIRLGISAGGATDNMQNVSAWRFFSPPSDFIRGIAVDGQGNRIINEDLYGATFSKKLIKDHQGECYLIVDREIFEAAKRNGLKESLSFQALQLQYLFKMGTYKADTLSKLAKKIKVDELSLIDTIRQYNNAIALGEPDPMHKAKEICTPLIRPPFYAVKMSIKNSPFFPTPGLTLGGLKVDEQTGEVLNTSGQPISALYAAGRTAVGICSNSYISGLSLADAVFSGRRAARHLASKILT
ncbi:MAG: FAD-binding protein [Candidatus Pristimantibacillus sp.]